MKVIAYLNAIVVCGALAVAGCGSVDSNANGDAANGNKIEISPPSAELLVENNQPVMQAYTATLVTPDGTRTDITNQVAFTVNPGFGTFAGPAFTATGFASGKTEVNASYDGAYGKSDLIVRVKKIRVDPAVPADAANLFANPTGALDAPQIAYPPQNVVMPRNLGEFEVHWRANNANVFEVSLTSTYADIRAIVPGPWLAFSVAEWIAATGTDTKVNVRVRSANKDAPGAVGTSADFPVVLSNETLDGGIYYWGASGGPVGVYRHDWSKPGQPPEEYYTPNQSGNRCVGCHTLSRDGTRMALTLDSGNGPGALLEVQSKNAKVNLDNWNFATYTPDNQTLLTIFNGVFTVRDPNTGAHVATISGIEPRVSHPEFSPMGSALAYTACNGEIDFMINDGELVVRDFDPTLRTLGPARVLSSSPQNEYYPSWSPDGKWILFNRADGGSYNNGNAMVWLTRADGQGQPIELRIANVAGGLTNSWPRWAPFPQTIGENREPAYWITFSSTREFGVRLDRGRPQVWMAAIYPDRAARGEDPSTPAFRLPFQSIDTSNHIAQWTERVVVPE